MKLRWKRPLAFLLSAAMTASLTGGPVYATTSGKVVTGGLCEHHTEHDEDCGYAEGVPCGHEHKEDCYTLVENCVHKHTDQCYPEMENGVFDDGATSSDADKPTECDHVCGEETGCITEELDCLHEHDEDCGYLKTAPCTFVCVECRGGRTVFASATSFALRPLLTPTVPSAAQRMQTLRYARVRKKSSASALKNVFRQTRKTRLKQLSIKTARSAARKELT